MKPLDVSVVIPTRDRPVSLARTLTALARQRLPPGTFEVVVAVDGGTDAGVGHLSLPYDLTVVSSTEHAGAAAARNRGAAAARGDLLVFLDDDIQAEPGLIGAHVRAHHEGANVTIGYLPAAIEGGARSFFQIALRGWWEAMFAAMRRPGHRYWFRDLLTGNCAVDASLFERTGGFDEGFRCHEDYEIGVRLIDQRATFRFVEEARGLHHELTGLGRALARKRDEGRADVLMARKHPRLVPSLPMGAFTRPAPRRHRLLRRLVFEYPAAGRAMASVLVRSLAPLEAGRFRGRWTRRLDDLLLYWYWRGVADELRTLPAVEAFLDDCAARSGPPPMMLEVDVANGLELVMAQVDRHRPDALRVTFEGRLVGTIEPVPGAEGLTGRHLRAALAREFAGPLVAALGRAGVVAVDSRDGRALEATGPLPAHSAHF